MGSKTNLVKHVMTLILMMEMDAVRIESLNLGGNASMAHPLLQMIA